MSFIAKLKLDGEEMNVLRCSFRFSQVTDTTGRPTSVPKGGGIEMTIETTGSTNLFDWMISPVQVKSGVVTFYRRDTMSKLKVLEFSEAHCVDYTEMYNHTGDHPMQIHISLRAKDLKLNDSEFKNNWPE